MGEACDRGRSLMGRRGEDAALKYLQLKGLSFRERNWRYGHLEVDLIFEDSRYLRIVEVKTLSEKDGFDPSVSVTKRKAERLITAARHYAAVRRITKEVVFDVVTVTVCEDGRMRIRYIPEAFWPMEGNWFTN
ncbi:MAG: YraN family protein [Bacteroidales bacterium]|nr:YraN family protein [Bacteroidales bacterium]